MCRANFPAASSSAWRLRAHWRQSPKILFADEPTGNLDGETGKQIIELIFGLHRRMGTTLVLITHDTNLAARCERTVTINDGRIVGERQAAAYA